MARKAQEAPSEGWSTLKKTLIATFRKEILDEIKRHEGRD